jgi:hypothetical protein
MRRRHPLWGGAGPISVTVRSRCAPQLGSMDAREDISCSCVTSPTSGSIASTHWSTSEVGHLVHHGSKKVSAWIVPSWKSQADFGHVRLNQVQTSSQLRPANMRATDAGSEYATNPTGSFTCDSLSKPASSFACSNGVLAFDPSVNPRPARS